MHRTTRGILILVLVLNKETPCLRLCSIMAELTWMAIQSGGIVEWLGDYLVEGEHEYEQEQGH